MVRIAVPAAGVTGGARVGAFVQTAFEFVFVGGMPAHVLDVIQTTIGDLFFAVDCSGTLGGSGRTGLNAISFAVFLGAGIVGATANARA